MTRGVWQATVHGVSESDVIERLTLCYTYIHICIYIVFIMVDNRIFNVTLCVMLLGVVVYPSYI